MGSSSGRGDEMRPASPAGPSSELDQHADPPRQLAAFGVGAAVPEGGCAGEVTAALGAELEELVGVPVDAGGHLGVVGVDAGPGAPDVVEPFRTTEGVDGGAHVQDVDEVQAIPRAGADRGFGVPSHVVLEDLGEVGVPLMLD